jgi:hypothetical protein
MLQAKKKPSAQTTVWSFRWVVVLEFLAILVWIVTLFCILFDKPYAYYSGDFKKNDNVHSQLSYYADSGENTVVSFAGTMHAPWGQFPALPDMGDLVNPRYTSASALPEWHLMLYSLNRTLCAPFVGEGTECEIRYTIMNESDYKTVSMGMLQHPGFALLGMQSWVVCVGDEGVGGGNI